MEQPSRWSRFAGAGRHFCTSPQVRSWMLGALCGSYLLVWCHAFLARWGTAWPVVAGLAAGMTLGLETGWWRRRRSAGVRRAPWTSFVRHLGLAGWTVALPWLTAAWSAVIAQIPVEKLAAPMVSAAVMIAGGIVLMAVPMHLLIGLGLSTAATASSSRPATRHDPVARWLSGMAGGLAIGVFVVAPWLGLQTAASLLAIVGAALAFVHLTRSTRVEPAASVPGSERTDDPGSAIAGSAVWAVLACCAAGAFFAAGERLAHQLMPAAAYTLAIQWAALLLSAAWGLNGARRRLAGGTSQRRVEAFASCWAAMICALVPLGLPLLTDLMLLLNAHVSSVWMLMAGRSLIAGLLVAPVGICAGVLLSRLPQSAAGEERSGPNATESQERPALVAVFAALAAGLVLARLLIGAGSPAASVAIAAAAGLALLGIVRTGGKLLTGPAWAPRLAGVSACAMPVLALLFCDAEQPARAARLLFSTNVFLAKQAGLNAELLASTDDARLVGLREGQHGTYTLWKLRGVQYQLRESGMPKSVVSGDPRMCPQYPPEIMQAVLPLVLHDRPSRVLLLGIGSGGTLTTLLRFPILEVTCAEGDPELIDLLQQHVWDGWMADPFADPRLTALPLDPPLTLAARHTHYDVIISNAEQSALLSSAACFTAEFYANAARCLTADGLFCQRFQALDYGAAPLTAAARTLRTAFRRVALVETGVGEYALLATNSAQGLVRDALVERLQAPQVRSVLAEAGWDWSILLNLTTYADEDAAGFADHGDSRINTAANGYLAYRLPQEVIRWAPKAEEIQAELGSHATRFLASENVDGEDPDLLRRLGEVSGQRNIVAGMPDQYWAYRKAVREQITERPRSLIVPVKGDVLQSVHPIDQRRLDYFAALGEALKHRPPEPDHIRHVAEFAVPYDPLLSYFLHQEVAELYARLPERDFAAELPHRMYAIYFADGQDRSVRNVSAALVLLAEQADVVPDPVSRWDHLNGLLQMLQLRWRNRGAVPPKSSRIVLNDIEKSIAGVEAAFEAMDEIASAHDIPHAHWDARRMYLERTLLRPLRTYRSQVLPHHLKRKRLAERTGEDADALDADAAVN